MRQTVVCLTSHAYFNLDGADTIEQHLLRVDAEEFLPVDDAGIPLPPERVAGTAFDLRRPAPLGERIRTPTRRWRAEGRPLLRARRNDGDASATLDSTAAGQGSS